MWIFTTIGFLSAVEDRQIRGNMLVRFRDPDHARAFLDKAYLGRSGRRVTIRETPPPADYRWKLSISRERFQDTVTRLAAEIDYSNFKSACHKERPEPYEGHELSDVWGIMNQHQQIAVRRQGVPPPRERFLFDDIEPIEVP